MEAKKKRLSKPALRAVAWTSGALAFGLPWAAFQLAPSVTTGAQAPSAQQVVVVPAGSRVVLVKAPNGTTGVKVLKTKGGTIAPPTTAAPVTTTGGSAPPP
jgi:hypothetical protein